MLRIVKHMRELDFSALMKIYTEGNQENGRELWPDLEEGQQLLRAEQDFYQYLREVFFRTNGAVYCLWEVQDRPVSALRLEPYRDGLLMGALETIPQERRQGYARDLICSVLQWLGQQGSVPVYSHVSKRNQASFRTHISCGFRKILDHAVYSDGSVLHNSVTFVWEK